MARRRLGDSYNEGDEVCFDAMAYERMRLQEMQDARTSRNTWILSAVSLSLTAFLIGKILGREERTP